MLAHWRKLAGGVTDRSCHVNPARAKPISLVHGGRLLILGQNQNQISFLHRYGGRASKMLEDYRDDILNQIYERH